MLRCANRLLLLGCLTTVGSVFFLQTSAPVQAQAVTEYGDEDLCNTGTYPSDPKAGATLFGLAPNAVTFATGRFGHGFPFSPALGDYPGTDQIFVGSVQTAVHDGYSEAPQRINGPQVITLDYGSLIPAGKTLNTLTLGIDTDDFQFPPFGQPYTAMVNGTVNTALTNALNSVDDTGPVSQFLTIGLDPTLLGGSNVLTLSIDQGGDGGDGWAIDFLTVGVTTSGSSAVPEPACLSLLFAGGLAGSGLLLRRRKPRA